MDITCASVVYSLNKMSAIWIVEMEPKKIPNPHTDVPDEQRFQRYAHDAYLGNTATKYGLAAGLPPGPEDDLDLDELEELLRARDEEID